MNQTENLLEENSCKQARASSVLMVVGMRRGRAMDGEKLSMTSVTNVLHSFDPTPGTCRSHGQTRPSVP